MAKKLEMAKLLPSNLVSENPVLTGILENTFQQFTNPEDSVQLNGWVGTTSSTEAEITPSDVDHRFNLFTPALYSSTGPDKSLFLYRDFLNSLTNLGVDVTTLNQWLRSQASVLQFPINYDKFINYSFYAWVGGHTIGTKSTPAATWNSTNTPEYVVIKPASFAEGNDWQKFNYWIHVDDLQQYGLDVSANSLQVATAPIIEFDSDIELNSYFSNGKPSLSGTQYVQTKTYLNQYPLFNIYEFDGTFSGTVSSLFYYQQDLSATFNADLTCFPKLNQDGDYVFATGLVQNSALKFYKANGELAGLWKKSVSAPTATQVPSHVFVHSISATADNQTWTGVANGTTVAVTGTRSGYVGTLTTSSQLNVGDFVLEISEAKDFKFFMHNTSAPRFVENVDGAAVNVTPSNETDELCWLAPEQLYANFEQESRSEFSYSVLQDHFRRVMHVQDGFEGTTSYKNNARNITFNRALGGKIKSFGPYFSLLFSIIASKANPIVLLNFLEQQYSEALLSLDTFIVEKFKSLVVARTDLSNTDLILSAYESYRAADVHAKSNFAGTTSPINYWPATTVNLGITQKVLPLAPYFDEDMGSYVIRHHDGHVSQVMGYDENIAAKLVDEVLTFSGIPTMLRPTNTVILNKTDGNIWVMGSSWEHVSVPYFACRNSLVTAVEMKLYEQTFADQTEAIDTTSVNVSEDEYTSFLLKYHLTDYVSSTYDSSDAFTWNYKQCTSLPVSNLKARWFDLYSEYFYEQTGIKFSRPDLEPWKLLGYRTKDEATAFRPAWFTGTSFNWDRQYGLGYDEEAVLASSDLAVATVFWDPQLTSSIPTYGYPSVDSYHLAEGDVILTEGGVYKIVNGSWVKVKLEAVTLFKVSNGYEYAGTFWQYTPMGADFYSFEQMRQWDPKMWDDIKSARPSLKLCVNVKNDELIPPFVSALKSYSHHEALLTSESAIIAPSAALVFGDGSKQEMYWRKSLEFVHAAARESFRANPLAFITAYWGYDMKAVTGFESVSSIEKSLLGRSKYYIHGESLPSRVLTSQTTVPVGVWTCVDPKKSLFIKSDLSSSIEIQSAGVPFVYGDSVSVTSSSSTWTAASTFSSVGLNQTFKNFLRYSSFDEYASEIVNKYRNWEYKLTYRFGGLVRTDTFGMVTEKDGTYPSTAYDIMLTKHEKVSKSFYSALRVQLVRMGSTKLNAFGKLIPVDAGSDWEFRIEGYNPAHPYVTITEWDKTAASGYQTFFALGSEHTSQEWKHYLVPAATKKVHLPVTLVGIQSVIDFITGYSYELFKAGFTYNSEYVEQDALTGRTLNWQLEIEKFVDNVYSGIDAGSAYVCNPSINRLALTHDTGIMSVFDDVSFFDLSVNQATFDVLGSVIPSKYFYVDRRDARSITISQIPLFSANLFTDKYEHVLVLNSQFLDDDTSAVVFDSFLNTYITSAHLNYVRQRNAAGKPSYAGFFVSGSDLKRNITASVDNMGTYYDTTLTFDDKTAANHALSLLGHTNEELFKDLTIDSTAKFNFWRGMIQSKGTASAIESYASIAGINSGTTDEYWAYKIAEYGDAREKSFPEIKIGMNDVSAFTKIQFFSASDSSFKIDSSYLQIEASDSSRWYDLGDLGKGMSFESSQVSEDFTLAGYSPTATAPVYIKLKNKFLSTSVTISGCTATLIRTDVLKVTAKTTDVCKITGRIWLTTSAQSPIKLIDYADSVVTTDIGEWHPAIGKHDFMGMSIVNIVQDEDPAQYNFTLKTSSNKNFNNLKPWAKREVGRVWFDTSGLDYVPYWDESVYPSLSTRSANWGRRADWSNVKLYEWTESSVHPSEYDALAAVQEGDSTIDNSVKAQGKVAISDIFTRQRNVAIRPIAWSHAGSGSVAVNDAFGSITNADAIVHLGTNKLLLDNYRLDDAGITEGKSFGAWEQSYTGVGRPLSEAVVGANVFYDIGSSTACGVNSSIHTIDALSVKFMWSEIIGGNIGKFIGVMSLSTYVNDESYYVRLTDVNGEYDDTEILYLEDLNDSAFNVRNCEFNKFGIKLSYRPLTVTNTGDTVTAAQICSVIITTDLMIREGVNLTPVVPYSGDTVLANDVVTPVYDNGAISEYTHSNPLYIGYNGWRCWEVPSQSTLDADSSAPHNAWVPILGALNSVQVSTQIINLMKEDSLILNSGIAVKRFSYSWSEWTRLEDAMLKVISNGTDYVTFTLNESVDTSRLVVYVEGRMINSSNYEVVDRAVTLSVTVTEGSEVTAIYKKYTPTAAELAFDPDVSDDMNFQIQYKKSYDYTLVTARDANGNVTGHYYYFWVQDKSIPKSGQTISLEEATSLLSRGSSQWFAYDGYSNSTHKFDSCIIAGLNTLVKKNDAYKIRFCRNFTLREDPRELELRNVHTEWTLISPMDTAKIPHSLWKAVTNCVAETNENGIAIPSKIRTDYDSQNGTSTRYGLGDGQIFADPALVRSGLEAALLNTSLTVWVGDEYVTDVVAGLDYENSDLWFADSATSRITMNTIWSNGSVQLVNELFFSILELAFLNNYTFTEIFKTSLFTVQVSSEIEPLLSKEPQNGIF